MLSKLAAGLYTSPIHQILSDKCRHSLSNEGIRVVCRVEFPGDRCALNINKSIIFRLSKNGNTLFEGCEPCLDGSCFIIC